ncbi:MAG: hypothetical protein ACJAYC_002043 [Halieaceae bacterium]|jgi:hypothetical protein
MPLTNILESMNRTNYGEIENVNSNLMAWRAVEGQPGNYLKVLVIDEVRNRVDFLFKQDPHAEFAKHNHCCIAVAFTLEGLWGYREGEEMHFKGTYSYEPPGSAHTPYASEQGMVVYASFQGTGPSMLEILDEDDNVIDVLTIDFFKQYYEG